MPQEYIAALYKDLFYVCSSMIYVKGICAKTRLIERGSIKLYFNFSWSDDTVCFAKVSASILYENQKLQFKKDRFMWT